MTYSYQWSCFYCLLFHKYNFVNKYPWNHHLTQKLSLNNNLHLTYCSPHPISLLLDPRSRIQNPVISNHLKHISWGRDNAEKNILIFQTTGPGTFERIHWQARDSMYFIQASGVSSLVHSSWHRGLGRPVMKWVGWEEFLCLLILNA